jgi:oligopeptidase A
VAWDAVELPSQFMENYCWEREALDLFAATTRPARPFPEDLYERMMRRRTSSPGWMVRQLEFALFDFRMHLEYDPARGGRIYEILEEVREQVAVIRPPGLEPLSPCLLAYLRRRLRGGLLQLQVGGGAVRGCVLAFEEEGVFNPETGRAFLKTFWSAAAPTMR